MKNPLNRLVTLLFLWVSSCNIAKTQSPDLILTHGNIFTADTTQLYVQAIAIKGNKILAVGSNGAIEKTVSSKTQKIDLQGKTVVPGFNDAHDHPGWYAPIGKSYNYTELNTAGLSKEAVLDSVARLVKIALPNEWICGRIGTTVLYDTSMREVLDSIAPNNPVALQIWWGHGLVVNHKALEASGLSDEDTDPTGGWYVRTPGTNKINSLQQNAQAPVWIAKTHSEPSNLIKGLQAFAEEQLRAGITSVQFMGTGFDGTKADAVFREASLPQRIRIIAWLRSTAEGRQLSDWETENMQPASLTYISGIKYVIDGTPLEENALRKTPYPDRPGWYGRLNYPIDTMKQILQEALSTDRQLMLHITADSSFAIVLSLMQQAGTANSPDQYRASAAASSLAYRTSTRALRGMQKEAVVSNGSSGSIWRMVCDEGPYLHGSDLAPFPLAFFCTGMASSYLAELLTLLREHRVPFHNLRLLQDNRYGMEGSATAGTMKGSALPVELQLEIDSPVPGAELQQYLAEAVAASPVAALLRQQSPGLFSLQLNDSPLALERLPACMEAGPGCPKGFADLRPSTLPHATDIIRKLKSAEARSDAPGGVGSSLAENQRRILHMRGSCQPRPDGLLETVVELFQPLGSCFRFLAEPLCLPGSQTRAPDSLAYVSAGIAFCYMTQLGRYAHILKRPLDSYHLVQDTRFSLPGVTGGTRQAGSMQPVQTHVFIGSNEDPGYIRTMVAMGEQTCFLHAACRDVVPIRLKPVSSLQAN